MDCQENNCSSSSSDTDLNFEYQNITVKFQISESQIVAQVYPNYLTIAEVKTDIGRKFDIDPEYLVLLQFEQELSPFCRLFDTCRNDFGILEFVLKVSDNAPKDAEGKQIMLNLQVYYNKFRLADFITVRIPATARDEDNNRDIVVEIQNKAIIKPFLGGYKDRKTDTEYHHAYTQTGPPLEKMKNNGFTSRHVQTVERKAKAIDTPYDKSTQSFGDARNVIHVSSANDVVIYPKTYQNYCEKQRRENKFAKIVLIQRNIKRWRLWKYVKRAAAEYRQLAEEQKRRDAKFIENYADKFKLECISKTFPRTKDDFDLLYIQVQKWKEVEIKRIHEMYSGGSRIAELHCLLDREIHLLNGIESQRNLVHKALQDYRNNKTLEKLGEPVKWIGYGNMVVEMDLVRTQRVRYLHALYKELQKNMDKEGRLELINKITTVLKNQEYVQDIAELLDLFGREKRLLIYSKSSDVHILRKRELVLFNDIIKMEKGYKLKNPPTKMCETCQEIKPAKDFALRTRQSNLNVCKRCFTLGGNIVDNSIYKILLRATRRDERKRQSLSSYAFIMQEDDMKFLVESIWHGHSILSKSDDTDLRMPRWIMSEEWAPWNTICLTASETRVHLNLRNLKEFYNDNLIQDINTKNLKAKAAFKHLHDADKNFVNTGKWWEAGWKEKVL